MKPHYAGHESCYPWDSASGVELLSIKYGKRGVRYAMIEAGHMGQNLFLQAGALGFKAGIIGAFHDKELIDVMNIPLSHEPLLIMPVGYQA